MVNSINEGWCALILSRCRNNNFLAACIKMCLSLLCSIVCTGTLHDVISTDVAPRNILGIIIKEYRNLLAVYNDSLRIFLNSCREWTKSAVIFEKICYIINICITPVNACEFYIVSSKCSPHHSSGNTTKTANSNSCHFTSSLM